MPAQNIREVLEKSELNNKNQHVVICSKGIEISSSKFLTEVIKDILPSKSISILSGPSFSNAGWKPRPAGGVPACLSAFRQTPDNL